VDKGRLHERRFWKPGGKDRLKFGSEQEYAEHHLSVITEAVRAASRTNAPLSVEVSGGLDSSSIFAITQRLAADGNLPAPSRVSGTMVFPGDPDADESALTTEIAAFVGAPIEQILPTPMNFDWYIGRARRELEFPGYPNGAMSVDLRTAFAARGAKVLFTGIGGDEWLGDASMRRGYYRSEFWSGNLANWWAWARSDARDFGGRQALRWAILRTFVPRFAVEPLRGVMRGIKRTRVPPSGASAMLAADLRSAWERRRSEEGEPEGWETEREADLRDPLTTWAVGAAERMCSQLGLTPRHPLRSAKIVEYSLSLPDRLLVRGRTSKYLHRKAFDGLLPPGVLRIGNKAQFTHLVRDHLRAAISSLPAHSDEDWLVPGALAYLEGRSDNPPAGERLGSGTKLWALGGYVGCFALAAKR
jgi:asparagine synthase (glutamine-hydrolysing)